MKHLLLLALIPLTRGFSCSRVPCQNGGSCLSHPNGTLSCLCLAGYVGEMCQFADPCTPGRCPNGGTCSLTFLDSSSPPDFMCVCPPGFMGKDCQGVVGDLCHPSPCQHGGTCQRLSGNQYRCQCMSGWAGKDCQLMDFCPAKPCANGGTCISTYAFIVCQCKPGFEGHTCQHDVNECFGHPSPCLNGGSCVNNIGSFHCICPPTSMGPLCQYHLGPCSEEVCHNGGTCQVVGERYYECLCPTGYTGQHCEVNPDDCVGHQCHNGGACQDGVGSYSCHCPPGWTGLLCHLHDACLSSPCHPDAHCHLNFLTGHAICICQQGYTGPTCYEDINECQMGTNPCEHGGSCHNTPGSFVCRCSNGYTGSRCESDLNECLSEPCLNGATCLDLLGQFHCFCPLGFSGLLCQVEECAKDTCFNGATCVPHSRGIICQCPPGFEGPQCKLEVDGCASNPCKSGGQCQNSAGVFHCICPQGFEGQQCERQTDLCHGAPCGHGSCMTVPGSFACICPQGYTGPRCTEVSDPCQTWQCFNQGSCQGTESGPHCICLPGWTGQDCGTEIDACDSSPCQQGATCWSHEGSFNCSCPSGYEGTTCDQDVDECRSSPCQNSGSCLNSPGSFRCLCLVGYTGSKCQMTLDLCSPNPCRNGGRCVMKESVPQCHCLPGWVGSRCQQRTSQNEDNCTTEQAGGSDCQSFQLKCLPGEECPNRGVCSKTTNGYRCVCPQGTKGPSCDLDPCSFSSAQCFHGGTCLAQPDGFSCICPPGYVGEQCQGVVDACFSQPCQQPGAQECQSHAHGFQCLCLPTYTGTLCESELDICQSTPCLNGGSCHHMADGDSLGFTCYCPLGYDGAFCEQKVPPCGFHYCHNGGVCISLRSGHQCVCKEGFSGPDCRLPRCPPGSCPAANVNTSFECQKVAGDGRCDRVCSSPETNWDGGDCSLGVLDPWRSCPKQARCWLAFRDGQCQHHCNNEDCLYDGFDCSQQAQCNPLYAQYCWHHFADGHCDRGCSVAPCGWDGGDCWFDPASPENMTLGLAVLLPRERLPQFLRNLAVAVRGILRLQRDAQGRERIYPYTGKEDLGNRSNWTAGQAKASAETIGFTVFLAMDGSPCAGLCPTSPQSALNLLAALAAKEALESLVPYTVIAAWLESVKNDPQASVSHFSGPLMYSVGAIVLAIALGIFIGVWKICRPKRREHGLLWFPPGFAPHQGKKRRCRREPVGEDAIGLKPWKLGAECVEDSDLCSSLHFDGLLNPNNIKGDPDSIPDQDHPRAKKPTQLGTVSSTQKDTKPKAPEAQRGVCGLTPLMPLACLPEGGPEKAWAERQTGCSGETPLHLAARYSRADAARRLLASGADANAQDQWGRTPLHSAIAADALGVFQILLQHRQTDLDASAHDGSTPLILATRLGVENVVEELIANRVDVEAVDKRGKSALHWAAAVNNTHATLVLLRNGTNKDAQDKRGQTPLFLAAQEGSYKVACLLLQHGAKRNIRDHMGRLAKDVALERLHHDILSLLDCPGPSRVAGRLPPPRPGPQPHWSATNAHKLSWQPCSVKLPPVPEREDPCNALPSPLQSANPLEQAIGAPAE